MPARGLGRDVGSGLDMLGPDDLLPDPDVDQSALTAALDWHWWGGVSPPPPVQIPLGWLTGQATFRQANMYNRAEVRDGDAVGRSATGGQRQWVFTATIDSISAADAGNLAAWVTAYYPDPRPRAAALVLTLNRRAETEIWRILGVSLGTQIHLTGTPRQTWPAGATNLIVEGITHRIVHDLRQVLWVTTPIVGTTAGVAGPWVRYGSSRYSGTDARPF